MTAFVFLPGSSCDSRLFEALITRLEQLDPSNDYHSVEPRGASIREMAEQAVSQFTTPSVVVGLSMGGIVSAEIARLAPEQMAGLALLATNLAAIDDAQRMTRFRWHEAVLSDGSDALRAIHDDLVPRMSTRRPEVAAAMLHDTTVARFIAENQALLDRGANRSSDVAALDARVVVGAGELDRVCPPEQLRDLAASIRAHDFRVFEGASHLLTIDSADDVARWLLDHFTPTSG